MPKGVHGDNITYYFRSKHIGNLGCLSDEWDETWFKVFVLKDTDYNIMMMSTDK